VSAQDGTVTFVFTDIERSTELARELGDAYRDVLLEHRRLLTDAFERSGGVVYSRLGDEVSAVFATAADAVAGAAAAQRVFAAHTWQQGCAVRVRIGVHTGPAPAEAAGEHVGLDVHRTARICAAAHGGQVILSDETTKAASGALPAGTALRQLGSYHLRGFPDREGLVQLVVGGVRNEFPEPRATIGGGTRMQSEARKGLAESLHRAVSAVRTRRQVKVANFDRRELASRPESPWVAQIDREALEGDGPLRTDYGRRPRRDN
jgi:class 3 adenylate cyclase